MNESAKLKVTLDEAGQGKVLLNGIDITDFLNAIEFKAACGQLTEIKLTIFAELEADITAKLGQITLAKMAQTQPDRGVRFLKSRKAQT